jgi:hypothetical protein
MSSSPLLRLLVAAAAAGAAPADCGVVAVGAAARALSVANVTRAPQTAPRFLRFADTPRVLH